MDTCFSRNLSRCQICLGNAFLAQNKVVDVSDVCCSTRSSQSSAITLPSNRALFIQMFQKIVQSSVLQSFCRKFFHQSLHCITFEPIQTFYWNMVFFAQTHFSVVCCRRLLPCKETKLVPSFINTRQLLTWRLKTLWRFSKPKITDIGPYSVQLFEDLTGVRFFEPQCIYNIHVIITQKC